jgi:multidrug resistance efflux pump
MDQALLDLARSARHAGTLAELEFIAVNGSHALAPYRQAVLWIEGRGTCALSGVVLVEANVPFVQWLARLCPILPPGPVDISTLPEDIRNEWQDWLPAEAIWIALDWKGDRDDTLHGGLLLARDLPWMDRERALLGEWGDVLAHALYARKAALHGSAGLKHRFRQWFARQPGNTPWWKRRKVLAAAAVTAALLFPVRLTVLAPGELVPLDPASVRSPLDGVIEKFAVQPNQQVRKGDVLFTYDEAELQARSEVALQSLATAEAEYRQAAQLALSDAKASGKLAALQGRIEERRAESGYLASLAGRASVAAPRDGIVLLDDSSELTGRPVTTGERILRIADPNAVEVEAWLGTGDAIDLEAGAPVRLYLASSPLDPVEATLRFVSYEAASRPDGSFAHRVRAKVEGKAGHRVGLKGTAKLAGSRVPLVYWMLRRPWAAVRQLAGI